MCLETAKLILVEYFLNKKQKKDTERQKKYYSSHKQKVKAYQKWYRKTYPERVKESQKISNRKHILQLKYLVFNHYSKGKMSCKCCNEDMIELLTIDHINNDGNKHRKEIKTNMIYRWLIKNNFPEGFQVLCMNCNWGKRLTGVCPHEEYVKGLIQ